MVFEVSSTGDARDSETCKLSRQTGNIWTDLCLDSTFAQHPRLGQGVFDLCHTFLLCQCKTYVYL